jgi:hypothetical protein
MILSIKAEEKYVSGNEAGVVRTVAEISGRGLREVEHFVKNFVGIRDRSKRRAKVQQYFAYLEPRLRPKGEFLNERMERERNAPPPEPNVLRSGFVRMRAAWEKDSKDSNDDSLSVETMKMLRIPTPIEQILRTLELHLAERNRLETRKLIHEQMVRAKRAELERLTGERNG